MVKRLVVILLSVGLNIMYSRIETGQVYGAGVAPTPYDYGIMSKIAYNINTSNDIADYVDELDGGLTWLNSNNWEIFAKSKSNGGNDLFGYFGVAFINHNTQQVVIANRGTDLGKKGWLGSNLIGDLINDMSILLQSPLYQELGGISFYKTVFNKLKANGLTYDISFTGHSLGAVVSDILGIKTNNRSITFDNPGSAYVAKDGFVPKAGQFISYQGPPNFINTATPQIGDVVMVDYDWLSDHEEAFDHQGLFAWFEDQNLLRYGTAVLTATATSDPTYGNSGISIGDAVGYVDFSLKAHNLSTILSKFNPTTGSPLSSAAFTGEWGDFWWGLAMYITPGKDLETPVRDLREALLAAGGDDDLFFQAFERFQKSGDPNTLDIAFVIDATGSMEDDIEAVNEEATRVVNSIVGAGVSARFAIVLYRDSPAQGDPWSSYVQLPFTDSATSFTSALASISVEGGGDDEEAVYAGLNEALSLDWQIGRRKAIILMGDAAPKLPDPTGVSEYDVLHRAYFLDPVVFYPIQIGSDTATTAAFTSLAKGSNGQVFTTADSSGVVDAVLSAMQLLSPLALSDTAVSTVCNGYSSRLNVGDGAIVDSAGLRIMQLPLRGAIDTLAQAYDGNHVEIIGGPRCEPHGLYWEIYHTPTGIYGWAAEYADYHRALCPTDNPDCG